MRTTIGTINTTADRASLGRVARVNGDQWHTRELAFVLKELAQLEKRPAMQCRSVGFSSLYPTANPHQFFDGNSLVGAFSLFDNVFADVVVCPGSKALFFVGEFLEAATRRLRTIGLQLGTQAAVTKTHVVNCLRGVDFTCAVYRDVGHTEIDAQKAVNVGWVGRFDLASGEQVELTVNQAKIGLAALPLQQCQLSLPCQEGDTQATINRPNAYLARSKEPTQNPRIVGNAAVSLERTFAFAVKFVGIGNLADRTHDYLRGDASGLPHRIVGQLVEAELIERLFKSAKS